MNRDWKTKPLGDFLRLQRGHDLTATQRRVGSVPVMGAAGQNGFHDTAKMKGPGIVVGRSGGSFGKAHFSESDFWPHNTALYVTDYRGNDVRFSYYLLKSIDFNKFNSGSAQPSLNRNYIYPIPIRVPEPDEQKKISRVLSAIDEKIDLNNRINAELEGMAKLLYDYWFVQFDFPMSSEQAAALNRPDLEGKPYKSSGGKMVYNIDLKRKIPEGWGAGTLSDIADIIMGQSPPGETYNLSGEGTLFYQGSTDFGWRFPTARQFTTQPTRFAKEGDILLSVRAPVGAMNIAPRDCSIGRGISALRSKSNHDTYLFSVMSYFKQIFDRRNADGTTFGAINKDDLHGLQVVIPDADIVESFEEKVRAGNAMIASNQKQNQQLAELRDWLLPMLMNGQVSVS